MTANVTSTEEMALRGREPFVVATLDVRYYALIAAESALARPNCKPHQERLSLRVRVTRPDGSTSELAAELVLVGGTDPVGKISLFGVAAAAVPVGSGVELLRYEVDAGGEAQGRGAQGWVERYGW